MKDRKLLLTSGGVVLCNVVAAAFGSNQLNHLPEPSCDKGKTSRHGVTHDRQLERGSLGTSAAFAFFFSGGASGSWEAFCFGIDFSSDRFR
jgi:hypothetical protein